MSGLDEIWRARRTLHEASLPVVSPCDAPFSHDQLRAAGEMLDAASLGAFGEVRTVLLTMQDPATAVLLIERKLEDDQHISYERLEIDALGNTEEVPHP